MCCWPVAPLGWVSPSLLPLLSKVSKDVRKLRVFEEALVSVYQQFLSLLNDYLSGYTVIQ